MNFKYAIGIDEMDEQHRELLRLADLAKHKDHDELEMNNLVLQLLNYATGHLDQEEAYLKANGLESFLAEHIKLHRLFRIKAMDFYSDFRGTIGVEAKAKLLAEIGEFCEKWLIEHIDDEDRKYAKLILKC